MLLNRLRAHSPLAALAAPAVAAYVGFGVGEKPVIMAPVFLLAALTACFWLALRPHTAVTVALVLLAIVPIAGLPRHGLVHPAVLVLVVTAIAVVTRLSLRGPRTKFGTIDMGAAILFGGMAISRLMDHQTTTALAVMYSCWLAPFAVGRAIAGAGEGRAILKALAVAALIVLPFGVIEALGTNVQLHVFGYANILPDNPDAFLRLGKIRTQGAQGHPILWAMFLTTAAVASVTIWYARRGDHDRGRGTHWWLVLAAALTALQSTTISRTGFLVMAVAGGAMVLASRRTLFARRNALAISVAVVAAVAALGVPQSRQLLLGGGTNTAERASLDRSARYRSELIDAALQPGYFPTFGTTKKLIGPGGVTSIDNAFILTTWQWGYSVTIGFALIFLGAVWKTWTCRRSLDRLAFPALVVALMVAMTSVALFDQMQLIVWLMIGAAAGVRPVAPAAASRRIPRRFLVSA